MKLNQKGAVNSAAILVILVVLLIASLIFAFWAFAGRQKYKNDSNQLVSTAVTQAKAQQSASDTKAYNIAEQKPLINYVGPSTYGSISIYYPKTWSSYVNTSGGSNLVDGYFMPGTLSSVTDDSTTNFALRLAVVNQAYSSVLQQYDSEVSSNQASVSPYSLPKVSSVVGVKVVGQVESNISGTMIILPLRAYTLEVWTEGSAYLSQFNEDILPNMSFSP